MRIYLKIAQAIHKVSYFFSWVAAFVLALMMLLTFVDVVGRYLFNRPLTGAQDILEQLMVTLVFCVLGHVTLSRMHIRADLINSILSRRKQAINGAIALFIALIPVAIMTWSSFREASKVTLESVTGIIGIPILPFYYLAAFGLALCSAEIVLDIIKYIGESRESESVVSNDSLAQEEEIVDHGY